MNKLMIADVTGFATAAAAQPATVNARKLREAGRSTHVLRARSAPVQAGKSNRQGPA